MQTNNINSNLAAITKEKQEAKTPDQVIDSLKKEQGFLSQLHATLKHPDHHGQALSLSIQNAVKNEQDNVIGQLHKLSSFVQSKNYKTHEQMTKILKDTTDPMGTHNCTEVICNSCKAHLGHVFFGEEYTKLNTRYCINSLAFDFVPYINVKNTEEAIVAAGCFWGVEHLFNKLDGVLKAEVGYTGGLVDYPTYEQVCNGDTGHVEAVRIVYDPKIINYTGLIQYFFEIHDFSQVNCQGPDLGEQYLSKIFYHSEAQYKLADKVIQHLQNMGYKVATQLHPATTFWKAEAYHQQYYNKNSGQPYCHIRKKNF